MSGRLVGAVLKDRLEDAPPRARQGLRAVLVVLAEAARGENGVAWPSTATIADRSLFSQRQVVRLLGQLEDLGRIRASGSRSGGRSHTTRWQVIPRSEDAVKGDISPPIHEPERVTSEAVKGDTQMSPEPCEPFPPLPPAERGESDHRTETQGPATPSLPGLGRGEEGMPAIGRGSRAAGTNRRALARRQQQEADRQARQERDARIEAVRRQHEQEEAERESTREERIAAARAVRERVRSLPRAAAGGR